MATWAVVVTVLLGVVCVGLWLVSARLFVDWWDQKTYKPRMRRGK